MIVIAHARGLKIKGQTPTSPREKIPPALCRREKIIGRFGPDSPDDLEVIPHQFVSATNLTLASIDWTGCSSCWTPALPPPSDPPLPNN